MIHHLAHQDGTCFIGEGTRIWQFASIIRKSSIGKSCSIASGVSIDGARVGDRCVIGHNCSINPGVWIGDGVFIGPLVTFCNDMWPRASKEGFDADHLLDGSALTAIVKDGASIGAGVTILPGLTIGEGSIIAAGLTVTRSVPKNSIYWRNGTISEIIPGHHERIILA